ncbi:unnamed protein product [Vitrella brassicaformis CCMP3155]|uniref:Uncharacterized protein n=1 Tax=Vitrella brassicaformis (strain CCMP3155) TaxID=1169540 RepID=A0A0G4FPH4_VITBC|nr:unnamed protein product [Vitrella brassicaformis CCMP3155]|eukprot:CEM15733.1 unnamed protein product [Vitrella brassicaformis CCMP3155]
MPSINEIYGGRQRLKVLSNVRANPKWTIKGRPRDLSPVVNVPGPGTYGRPAKEVESNQRTAATTVFGTSHRDELKPYQGPGPGAYQYAAEAGKGIRSPPQYTMTPRRPDKSLMGNDLPSPDAYMPTGAHLEKAPVFGFGSCERKTLTLAEGPGPGTYRVTLPPATPSYGLGTTPRPSMGSKEARNSPGPGAYSVPSPVGEGPKYSLGAKYTSLFGGNGNVGPGGYEVKSTVGDNIQWSLRGRPKDDIFIRGGGKHTPGPGNYRLERSDGFVSGCARTSPRWGFGSSARKGLTASSDPSPCEYQINDGYSSLIRKQPMFGFGSSSRPPINSPGIAPGPGNYQVASLVGRAPMYSMTPRREAIQELVKRRYNTPAPGTYRGPDQLHGPRWGFGSSMRSDMARGKEGGAGPGAYAVASLVGEGPKISLSGRPKDLKPFEVPGPGHYMADATEFD